MPHIYEGNCDNCGKPYSSAARYFCSNQCATEKRFGKKEIITKYCKNCGRVLAARNQKMFCSVPCRIAMTGTKRAEEMHKKNTKWTRERFNEQELRVMYYKHLLSINDMALSFGCSTTTMRRAVNWFGFKLRSSGEQLSIIHKGRVRDKDFIQKHIDWYKSKSDEEKVVILAKIFKSTARKPNKPEKILINFFRDASLPYKYTGDYSLWINGKNPDFVNCNGQKKIIELFGEHWHDEENAEERVKLFSKFGYSTLIIWASELKDMQKVSEKIRGFDDGAI